MSDPGAPSSPGKESSTRQGLKNVKDGGLLNLSMGDLSSKKVRKERLAPFLIESPFVILVNLAQAVVLEERMRVINDSALATLVSEIETAPALEANPVALVIEHANALADYERWMIEAARDLADEASKEEPSERRMIAIRTCPTKIAVSSIVHTLSLRAHPDAQDALLHESQLTSGTRSDRSSPACSRGSTDRHPPPSSTARRARSRSSGPPGRPRSTDQVCPRLCQFYGAPFSVVLIVTLPPLLPLPSGRPHLLELLDPKNRELLDAQIQGSNIDDYTTPEYVRGRVNACHDLWLKIVGTSSGSEKDKVSVQSVSWPSYRYQIRRSSPGGL